MRPSASSSLQLSTLLTLPGLINAASSFDCHDIVKDRLRFDLKPLGGPHMVHDISEDQRVIHNMTYTIDICKPLRLAKNVPKGDQCKPGTWVCGIDFVTWKNRENATYPEEVIPIAGDYSVYGGPGWDPKWQLLRNSGSHTDADREGLLVEFDGGNRDGKSDDKKDTTPQKAIVEFICDHDRTGLEEDEKDDRPKEDGDEERNEKRQEEGEKKGKKSLQFRSYKKEKDVGVLRLDWYTRYACEDAIDNPDINPRAGWGFFTWFLIILFLAISTYLIFGSWLNYNRYGARGWDLLPHGDTIRDMPYLMKDWGRRVVNTIQGPGPRGGYSAVQL